LKQNNEPTDFSKQSEEGDSSNQTGFYSQLEEEMKKCLLVALLFMFAATVSQAQTATTVVTFDNPAPSAGAGAMPATFDGMTFGASWSWESAWNADSTNNVYFSSATNNTRSFGFVQPEIFLSLQVLADAAGTLTLADDQGQTTTFQVAQTATMYTVRTGWTKASKTVSVTYTQNWHAAFDNFTYQTPSTASGSAGKLAASITLTWDDNTPATGSVLASQIIAGNQPIVLGQFPLSSSGIATGTLAVDLTQPSPLAFQIVLMSTANVQVGDSVSFQLPKAMFPANATGVTAHIVLLKATTTIKTFDIGLTP
jgi:hypothetical protein